VEQHARNRGDTGPGRGRQVELATVALDRVRDALPTTAPSATAALQSLPQVLGGTTDGVLEGVVEPARRVVALQHRVARRWPWAVGAAVAGAAAGAAVAVAVRHLVGEDAPDALEPDQLRAVVDVPVVPPAR